MSDTASGLLTIAALLGLLAAAHVPLGDSMATVLTPDRHNRVERMVWQALISRYLRGAQRILTDRRDQFTEAALEPLGSAGDRLDCGQSCAATKTSRSSGFEASIRRPPPFPGLK